MFDYSKTGTNKIWFTSDLHFCHDREFVYVPRGFKSVDEMNNAIVERWNNVVGDDDFVFVLGDLMLGNNEKAVELVKMLKGKLVVVLGNHDTDNRIELYKTIPNIVHIEFSMRLRANGYHFFLTHYPCLTGSLEHDTPKKTTINLFGHTHSKNLFYEDRPYMYNVALDAHNCTPVSLDTVIEDVEKEYVKCKKML